MKAVFLFLLVFAGAALAQNSACVDTDNGRDSGIAGAVSGFSARGSFYYTDSCAGSRLREWHCSRYARGTQPTSTFVDCAARCESGACLSFAEQAPETPIAEKAVATHPGGISVTPENPTITDYVTIEVSDILNAKRAEVRIDSVMRRVCTDRSVAKHTTLSDCSYTTRYTPGEHKYVVKITDASGTITKTGEFSVSQQSPSGKVTGRPFDIWEWLSRIW